MSSYAVLMELSAGHVPDGGCDAGGKLPSGLGRSPVTFMALQAFSISQASRPRQANELALSNRSIGNHLAKIYAKLRVHNRPEAILYAIRTGLAQVE